MRVFCGSFILLVLVTSNWGLLSPPSAVSTSFAAYDVFPDVVSKPPDSYAKVEFSGGVQAILGNILSPSQVKNEPSVSWPANSLSYYTLACVDPDEISRQNPNISEFKYWLVGNIPGDKINRGEVLASYYSPTPSAGSSFHRYSIVIYRQKKKINFEEPRNLQMTYENRTRFSTCQFSEKYNLEGPVAGNFFLAQLNNIDC
ncbi:protein D3-like [Epargyreus clarus]|uniref:protein D3-like n=1 Tax=Epargyreus clarus TaxID=520877 RepID=UPI003C2E578A